MRIYFVVILLGVGALQGIAVSNAATWKTYDPSLGTLPQAQGFTLFDTGDAPSSPSVSGGILSQGPTSGLSPGGYQYWYSDSIPFDFTAGFTMEARLKVISSSYDPNGGGAPDAQRAGYYLAAVDGLGRDFFIGIASGGIFINTDASGFIGNGVPLTSFDTTDAFHDYLFVVSGGAGKLYVDDSLFASTPIGAVGMSSPFDTALFGDGSHSGVSTTQLELFRYEPDAVSTPEPGTIGLLVGGLTIAALTCRRSRRRRESGI